MVAEQKSDDSADAVGVATSCFSGCRKLKMVWAPVRARALAVVAEDSTFLVELHLVQPSS